MYSKPYLLQGVYDFEGRGLQKPFALSDQIAYTVPEGKRTQLMYFRAGNSSGEMIYVVLMRDNAPMRYFPIGAKQDTHVALAVVEDLMPETRLEAFLAAPEGASGSLVIDIGMVEIRA